MRPQWDRRYNALAPDKTLDSTWPHLLRIAQSGTASAAKVRDALPSNSIREYLIANAHVWLVVDGIGFLRPTDYHRISPGEKIAVMPGKEILKVRLGRQQDKLPFDRVNQPVSTNVLRSKPGTVHDDAFRHSRNFTQVLEFSRSHGDVGGPEIVKQLGEKNGRLNQ